MDYSTSQLQDARDRLSDKRLVFVAANLYQMPFAESAFDTALMVRVLHHLSDVPQALGCIHHILYPGGTFILEYPNKRNLKAVLRYLLRLQEHSPFSVEPWEFVELNYDFHPSYVEHHLETAGFQIARQLSVSHFRIGLLKRLVPPRVLATLDAWLQQPTAKWKWTPSMFVQALARGQAPGTLAGGIFRCPVCHGADLSPQAEALICSTCGRRWSTAGGIYDFRRPLP
jgi:SAM-dependent methyltransferase